MKYKELEAQRECDLKRKIKIKYGIEGVIDYILSKSNIPITLDLLVDEYNSGAFLSDLSQKYGIPIGDITRIFDLKNIKRRSPHENTKLFNDTKLKNIIKEKYGVENVFQLSEVKEKIKKTNLEKYGCENPLQNDSIKEKVKQTCLEKYGVNNFSKTKDFCKKRKKKYSYNGESFDSSWELAFYVYHTDLGEKVEHETTEFIYYYNGIEYKYIPDFKIQNTYYEIKGNHFFNENKMINPFDPSQNDLYEAKHKCG